MREEERGALCIGMTPMSSVRMYTVISTSPFRMYTSDQRKFFQMPFDRPSSNPSFHVGEAETSKHECERQIERESFTQESTFLACFVSLRPPESCKLQLKFSMLEKAVQSDWGFPTSIQMFELCVNGARSTSFVLLRRYSIIILKQIMTDNLSFNML